MKKKKQFPKKHNTKTHDSAIYLQRTNLHNIFAKQLFNEIYFTFFLLKNIVSFIIA